MPVVLTTAQQRIHADLEMALAAFALPEPLKKSVQHAVLLGGKRVRPALCYAAGEVAAHAHHAAVRRAAVAIELIHCYSLVHDDLPCMDNDLLRRGQPTCHAAYGEQTALLAGDILQSLAFEVLSSRLFDESRPVVAPQIVLKQLQLLATASSKMVCGQVLDLQAEGQQLAQAALEQIHLNKTGALIQAAIMMGAVCAVELSDAALPQLRSFGRALGLAFQVQDDILDITASTTTLGKTAGKDIQVQKSTYPALMGLAGALQYAQQLHDEAFASLQAMGDSAQPLREIAQYLLHRQY